MFFMGVEVANNFNPANVKNVTFSGKIRMGCFEKKFELSNGIIKQSGIMKKLLIVGAVGQIGSELTMALRGIYGNDNVVASTRKTPPSDKVKESGPFEFFNVNDREKLHEICKKHLDYYD